MKTLGYSCHVLQSFLLTETQWIHRNFIGQETKPGHLSICSAAPGGRNEQMEIGFLLGHLSKR